MDEMPQLVISKTSSHAASFQFKAEIRDANVNTQERLLVQKSEQISTKQDLVGVQSSVGTSKATSGRKQQTHSELKITDNDAVMPKPEVQLPALRAERVSQEVRTHQKLRNQRNLVQLAAVKTVESSPSEGRQKLELTEAQLSKSDLEMSMLVM